MKHNRIMYLFLMIVVLFFNTRGLLAVNKKNKALRDAARRCSYEDIVMAIQNGANVETLDKKGRTLLHLVVKFGARVLGEEDSCLVARDEYQDGLNEFDKIIAFLVNKGININARDHKGRTPFHYASMAVKVTIEANDSLPSLLKYGAKEDFADHNGKTTACFAIDQAWKRHIKEIEGAQKLNEGLPFSDEQLPELALPKPILFDLADSQFSKEFKLLMLM